MGSSAGVLPSMGGVQWVELQGKGGHTLPTVLPDHTVNSDV